MLTCKALVGPRQFPESPAALFGRLPHGCLLRRLPGQPQLLGSQGPIRGSALSETRQCRPDPTACCGALPATAETKTASGQMHTWLAQTRIGIPLG